MGRCVRGVTRIDCFALAGKSSAVLLSSRVAAPFADRSQQRNRVDRLSQIRNRAPQALRVRDPAHDDDGYEREPSVRPKLLQNVVAVVLRQDDVEKHERRRGMGEVVEGLAPIASRDDFVPGCEKPVDVRGARLVVVFHDEDLCGLGGWHPRSCSAEIYSADHARDGQIAIKLQSSFPAQESRVTIPGVSDDEFVPARDVCETLDISRAELDVLIELRFLAVRRFVQGEEFFRKSDVAALDRDVVALARRLASRGNFPA